MCFVRTHLFVSKKLETVNNPLLYNQAEMGLISICIHAQAIHYKGMYGLFIMNL